jgi:glycosyltransferase involved in cell wall biosynthesis
MNISVVIPCRNEVKYIQECIEAIYQNEFSIPVQLHVFVVDGMSDDGTRELVEQMMLTFSSLKLVDNSKKLTPYAFNLGIHARAADYIQIVGARHILSSNYIQKSLSILLEQDSIWCVGGKLINEYVNETGEIISKAMSTTFGMGIGNFRTLETSGYSDTVTSPMYPMWVFEKIGYFDEDLIRNQDDDFNFRVSKAGGKIWFESTISLKYYVRGNFKGLYRQFYQYGYWKVFVNQKHKAVTTLRQLVPPAFVMFLFLSPFSFFLPTFIGVFTVILYGIYFLLGCFFSFKLRKSLREFFQLFKTFPILHFSYGLGYLSGMLQFLVLRQKPSDKQKRLSR